MNVYLHQDVRVSKTGLSRRSFLRYVSAAGAAAGTLGFHDLLSVRADELRRQGRAMILLWMQGGPSQFETFDPKPGQSTGGPTDAIDTAVPGIQIAEGWEHTAHVMSELALIRSMTNREGNHQRATYQLHTGYVPSGSVKHPSLGSSIAKEIADPDLDLPAVVSVGQTQGAGFLGVDYEPFIVRDAGRLPDNARLSVPKSRYDRRLGLLGRLEDDFAARGAAEVVESHRTLYQKAARLVTGPNMQAFDIGSEPAALRERYGDTGFGRGCLLARRLVEAGVTFVEVRSNGWDTHQENFAQTKRLSGEVDPGMAALLGDLKERGMLERTLVVWMGEFGRTPRINARTGRDHYPRVFSAALAGAGVRGGQVIGASRSDGTAVAERPVEVNDLLTSVCHALRIDPAIENMSPLGRPMRIVDGGNVIEPLFG